MRLLDPVKNFVKVTVDGGYDSTATSINLVTGDGGKLPDPATEGAYNLVWWDSTNYPDPSEDPNVEIVRVTAKSGDTLTIERAQEGTSATNKNTAGATYKMLLGITQKMLGDIDGFLTVSIKVNKASHGFAVGDVLRYDSTSGYVKALADSAANAEVVGIVKEVIDSDNFVLLTHGYISGLSGLTAGTVYFLSDTTPGALTDTEPTTEGSVSKPLLVAISATEGVFFNFRGVEITNTLSSYYGSFTDSDLSSGVLTITHNLGHQYCSVTIIDNNNKVIIPDEITYVDANSLTVDLSSFGTISGTWRYVVLDIGSQWTGTIKKIQDADADTYIDTEETSDADEIVGKVAGVECLRFYNSGILDLPKQSRVRVTKTTAQNIYNNSWTVVQYDIVDYDVQNEYDNTTNYRFTATKAGYYKISAGILFDSVSWSAGTVLQLFLYKNGSTDSCLSYHRIEASITNYKGLWGSATVYLDANDYIDIRVNHSQGGTISLTTYTGFNYFVVDKLG